MVGGREAEWGGGGCAGSRDCKKGLDSGKAEFLDDKHRKTKARTVTMTKLELINN